MTDHRAYRLSGRVQGVGFRWWTRNQASKLRLRGLVRNEPDGTVYVEAAGPTEALERFEALLGEGPPGAVVRTLQPRDPDTTELPPDFSITG